MGAADHLEVPRQHGLFLHHGIDLGDGSIAHYLEGRKILRSTFEEFSLGEKVTIVKHKKISSKRITLQRALSRIGEQNYNILFNNCEHFAHWCKTGYHRSSQMENFLNKSRLGTVVNAQIIPTALIAAIKILIKKGLIDEISREKAYKKLTQLTDLKSNLKDKLRTLLEELDSLIKSISNSSLKQEKPLTEKLIIQGQLLSDQLASLENLEIQIKKLLNKPNIKK